MGNADITGLLSGYGMKCTRQRVDVMRTLVNSNAPMSAEMIFSQLKNVSLSTVYRILERFTADGIVTRCVFNGSSEIYYEPSSVKHRHYTVCLGCHEVRYIDTCPVHDTAINNFTVTGHRVEFYGYCDKCLKKSAVPSKH